MDGGSCYSIIVYSVFRANLILFPIIHKKANHHALFSLVSPFQRLNISSFKKSRAEIGTGDDFKKDVKRVRKNAKQETVKALIPFHHREIYCFKVEIRKSKRVRLS